MPQNFHYEKAIKVNKLIERIYHQVYNTAPTSQHGMPASKDPQPSHFNFWTPWNNLAYYEWKLGMKNEDHDWYEKAWKHIVEAYDVLQKNGFLEEKKRIHPRVAWTLKNLACIGFLVGEGTRVPCRGDLFKRL